MADDRLKKLRKAAKRLDRDTSREDHKKPLSHQEQAAKEKAGVHVKDNEGRNKDEHKDD